MSKMARFKEGDLVIIKPKYYKKFLLDFDYYAPMYTCDGKADSASIKDALSDLLSQAGVGVIKNFNSDGEPRVIFKNNFRGKVLSSAYYYDPKWLKKVSK